MGAFAAGQVILLPFPFSDLTRSKLRPALLLADAGRDDWIACQITSNPYADPHAIALAQTPQGFSFRGIFAAHESARAEGLSFVDDAEVYARFVGPVAWVPGDVANRKITFADDLEEGA